MQWWPIADFPPLEKMFHNDMQTDGHNFPSHRCLFGYADEHVLKEGLREPSAAFTPLILTNVMVSKKMTCMVWLSFPSSLLPRITRSPRTRCGSGGIHIKLHVAPWRSAIKTVHQPMLHPRSQVKSGSVLVINSSGAKTHRRCSQTNGVGSFGNSSCDAAWD